MSTIIDLSQEIFAGMPTFPSHPEVSIEVARTHEESAGILNSETISPAVHKITLGEHTGSHVDALNHMRQENFGESIDTMPLSTFYTSGICLDLSHKGLLTPIEETDLEAALLVANLTIQPGDTVLIYTDHYRKHFGTDDWENGPGITPDAARWFGHLKVAAFGVETRSPGIIGQGNKEIHTICGEMRYTHYENLINLHQLVGKGRFQFIGLPLKIRGGTGSPVRAIAVFD